MAPQGPQRKGYPPEAWIRLGEAVAQARRAIGHRSAHSFAKATGRSHRSIQAVERGEGVGVAVLEAVGLTLGGHIPGWGVDTPESILKGGPVPDLVAENLTRVTSPMDVVWRDAREEFVVIFTSGANADALQRKTEHWRPRFKNVGFSDSDLLEVIKEARKAARTEG
jgi:hypothetical protein